jgi:hypothetical protein
MISFILGTWLIEPERSEPPGTRDGDRFPGAKIKVIPAMIQATIPP